MTRKKDASPALKAYDEATAPAWKTYNEAMAAAEKTWDAATDAARKAYKEATAPPGRHARGPRIDAQERPRREGRSR